MKKLKLHSANLVADNIDRIAELFPNSVTEDQAEDGAIKRRIDFDLLKQELSEQIVEGSRERYHLNWPGKREAILAANAPIARTLRPCRGESLNFDNTENLFIEGDNLEALKLLQETYLGKVKMIYIDPPYNTGNDFVYRDDFTQSADLYFRQSLQTDNSGRRLVSNMDSNGRFHSEWLSMMYSRLKLAKNLISDDGIIFISIDDNENHNLRKLCEEVFGEENFLAELIWHLSSGPQAGHFTRSHESIISFAKSRKDLPFFNDRSGGSIVHGALKKISAANPASEITFPKGSIHCDQSNIEFPKELGGSEKQYVISGNLAFSNGVLREDVTIKAGWAMKNQVQQWLRGCETFDSKGQKVKRFFFNSQGILFYEKERGTSHPKTVIPAAEVGGTRTGGEEVLELFGAKVMSFPKPVGLLRFLVGLTCGTGDLMVDFFAGSATSAHALLQLNAEDGGNRKFIMVQLPEPCAEDTEAFSAGYKTIAEIGKERIRRAGKKILEGDCNPAWNKDIGFRVLKIDSSNMNDVYYTPKSVNQGDLFAHVDNIKEGRTPEDLLFQVLLDTGTDLTLPIAAEMIQGKKVFFVNDDVLAACFEEGISESLVHEMAARRPLKAVFRDSGFDSDSTKINVEQIFKLKSPRTELKVI